MAFMSTMVKSASKPSAMRPLSARPNTRLTPWLVRSTKRSRLRRPFTTCVSMIGTSVWTPGMPEGEAG
ncbi:hypothetical protein D3C87_2161160 [compost metagenome]